MVEELEAPRRRTPRTQRRQWSWTTMKHPRPPPTAIITTRQRMYVCMWWWRRRPQRARQGQATVRLPVSCLAPAPLNPTPSTEEPGHLSQWGRTKITPDVNQDLKASPLHKETGSESATSKRLGTAGLKTAASPDNLYGTT